MLGLRGSPHWRTVLAAGVPTHCGMGILPERPAGAGRSRDSGQDARAIKVIVTKICNL